MSRPCPLGRGPALHSSGSLVLLQSKQTEDEPLELLGERRVGLEGTADRRVLASRIWEARRRTAEDFDEVPPGERVSQHVLGTGNEERGPGTFRPPESAVKWPPRPLKAELSSAPSAGKGFEQMRNNEQTNQRNKRTLK